jgi:putative spermidine/putrescine transport system substrate-binding protein
MWWSGAMQLRAMGQNVSMINPRGGYRGWFGGLALSRCVSDWALDAAYDYLNWWLTGPAGAYLCRQGGYFVNIEGVRRYLQNHEYEFWIDGKSARYDIFDNEGHLLYQKGNVREGGSLIDRMKSIAIWNTVMPEHNYLVRKWENLPWLKDIGN